ncbi:tyrosine-protein phosphatase [Pedobacter heparinus]|uniref:tyrosine-protein phosphatase n=1 Tax=Pedobacter heparinus TaxID=984 RepID=UPI00292D501F|nr:CpsB/CapC family capsule biosynthesis tyrosine phosphatase [Pedobacter heparinus]
MISFFHKKIKVTDVEWLGVDMHSHLLPGIDDGVKDIGQSIAFIKELKELGFTELICTPHIFSEIYPNTPETITDALTQVKTALTGIDLNVEINTAAEYMIDETFQACEDLLCLPGKHILVEMSYAYEMPKMETIIFDLQLKGYQVILAHPERYNFYHKQLDKYSRLKDIGVLFQLNLLSVNGYYGKDIKWASNYLLEKGFYDMAATDLHHEGHLNTLKSIVSNGSLYKIIGRYPFKNKELFSSKKIKK